MHKSAFFFSMLCAINTVTLAGSAQDNDILANAHRSQMRFREGHTEGAQPLVKMLEDAVAQSSGNARLWEALGHAYMSLQGSMYAGPSDMPALITVGEHARDAYARSLALDGNSALVRASHGMSQMVVSQLKGDGPGVVAGVDEMNAAVRLAPRSTAVRLTRAFTIIHLPPEMRDTNAVIEDLGLILDTAPGGRPEDVLHVMLGGPREARLRQAMRLESLDHRTAERRLDATDRARLGYVRREYGVDPEDPDLFHLRIDSTALDLETCVELIVAAAAARTRPVTTTPA